MISSLELDLQQRHGIVIIADKTSTEEMSIPKFCVEFNRYQKSLAESEATPSPSGEGRGGVLPPEPAPLQASDFPCLEIGYSSHQDIPDGPLVILYDAADKYIFDFGIDYLKSSINLEPGIPGKSLAIDYITVTKTTFSELKPGNHFFATGETDRLHGPISPTDFTNISNYCLLREDGIWLGCEEGEIGRLDHDWFAPSIPVFLFTLKEK